MANAAASGNDQKYGQGTGLADLNDIAEAIEAAESYADLAAPLRLIVAAAGMTHYAVVRLRGGNFEHLVQVVHNGPSTHADRLQHAEYWRQSPTLQRMLQGSPPVVYEGNVQWEAPADVPGFEHGVAFGASEERGMLALFLARRSPAVQRHELLQALSMATFCAPMLLTCFDRLHRKACPLSQRQLDCLRYVMAGHNAETTGRALDIGTRTVEQYLERARAHLGASTSLSAAVQAIDQGWLQPSEVFPLMAA